MPYRRRVVGGPILPAIVNFSDQYLRSYFSIQDWDAGANTCVSRPSLGDSGSRANMTNGSLNASKVLVPGTSEYVMRVPSGTNGHWSRLQGVAINTSLYDANIDYMWTLYLNFTQNPVGTDGGFGIASTRVFADTNMYAGVFAYRVAGQNFIGVQNVLTLGGTTADQKVVTLAPENVGFVFQWGLIAGTTVCRINLYPWQEAINPLPGGTYSVPGQNFHMGYSPYGAANYFRGDCGNMVSTIGNYATSVYDQLAYKMMLDYGVSL